MKNFLSSIFISLCLLVFIPNNASAISAVIQEIPSLNNISKEKSEIFMVYNFHEPCFIEYNYAKKDFSNAMNKDSNLSIIFGKEAFSEDNILRHFIFGKNKIKGNHKVHNVSL